MEGTPIINRKEAIKRGLRWYFTGGPCPKGHVAKRSVSNRECRKCVDEKSARKRREGSRRFKEKDKRKYWCRPEEMRERSRAQRAKHAAKRREYDRRRYHENPERQSYQKRQANEWWQKTPENRAKANFRTARRRRWIERATPPWLTKEHFEQIKAFYLKAQALSRGRGTHHVDHIIPLRGRLVCGLNVPWNLQILTAEENRKKRNKHADSERINVGDEPAH